MSEHVLATEKGMELFVSILYYTGAMCPKCSYGTRVTSKRWAKCKKCGERVERRPLPETHGKGD
jgi:tRNA(Ile2) C34 agmatinyltransferase TiaS